MRIWLPARQMAVCPDATVVCGEPQFRDADATILLNPTLLVEVTSFFAADDGTEDLDYRRLPALQEYLVIAQDEPLCLLYQRAAADQWLVSDAVGLDATLALAVGGGVTLALADLYERVDLPLPW